MAKMSFVLDKEEVMTAIMEFANKKSPDVVKRWARVDIQVSASADQKLSATLTEAELLQPPPAP